MIVNSQNIAVVSSKGLGDALIALVLSHNLQLNGAKVTTYSRPGCQLQSWFPTHTILATPTLENVHELLQKHDWVFAFDHSVAINLRSDNLIILKESSLNKQFPWVENIKKYCQERLKLKIVTTDNGITPPIGALKHKNYPHRVVIHPKSTAVIRDWPLKKFLLLMEKLKKNGLDPAVCVAASEREIWKETLPLDIQCPVFETLEQTAAFIYESGFLIGVDSGLGHLASNLGIPTLSLFARLSYAKVWRPGWANNRVVTPPPFFIGARLKHRTWKKCLSVSRVLKNFNSHYFGQTIEVGRNSPQ